MGVIYVKYQVLILLLFLIYIPITFGGTLTKNNEPLSNYTLIFFNLNTKETYETVTDNKGIFSLSENSLTDNTSRHDRISVLIGKNLTVEKKPTSINVCCNITAVGFFSAIKQIGGLDIKIQPLSNTGPYTHYFQILEDENLYFCSSTLAKYNNQIYYHESYFLNYNRTTKCEFNPFNIQSIDEGDYFLSGFGSDGPNSILIIEKFRANNINVTNPHPVKSEVIIKTNQETCLLENGKNETIDLYNPNETKPISVYSPLQGPKCNLSLITIEFNPVVNIYIDSIFKIGIAISILFALFRRRRRR